MKLPPRNLLPWLLPPSEERMFPWPDPGRLLGALAPPTTHPPPQPWCQWHPQPWRWDGGGGQGARQGPPRGKSLGSALTETGRHHNPVAQPGHLRIALYCFRQLASGEQWQTVMAYERKKVDKKQESVKERKSIVSALFWLREVNYKRVTSVFYRFYTQWKWNGQSDVCLKLFPLCHIEFVGVTCRSQPNLSFFGGLRVGFVAFTFLSRNYFEDIILTFASNKNSSVLIYIN